MKIYVVTQGYYSDYHVITATTDKNRAKAIAAIAKKFEEKGSATRIEVFEDDKIMLKPCWFVLFEKDGTIDSVVKCLDGAYSYENLNKCYVDVFEQLSVYVLAEDSVSAEKIAAEKRAQFLAEKAGL